MSDWNYRPTLSTENIADSAGAGDWFTAALISRFPNGLVDLQELSAPDLDEFFSYASAAAAWNCFFEGARTGMYAMSQEMFSANVRDLQEGRARMTTDLEAVAFDVDETDVSPACPACP